MTRQDLLGLAGALIQQICEENMQLKAAILKNQNTPLCRERSVQLFVWILANGVE